MRTKHLNLIFPQWQGGGQDLSTYYGAKEFHKLYLNESIVTEIKVSTDNIIDTVNDIFGYNHITDQMMEVHNVLRNETPDTIFTIGGGCDANIPSVSYLNHKLKGDMTVLWFDSHGDLNTPQSSSSKYFYGMPLRTLLGDGDDKIIDELPSTLIPSQVFMMGARDLDPEEEHYINNHSIPVISIADMELNSEEVLNVIRSKGSRNLYIHIDLDVLDSDQFPYVPVPMKNGLKIATLQEILGLMDTNFNIIGLDLMEYNSTGKKRYDLFEEICRIGTSL